MRERTARQVGRSWWSRAVATALGGFVVAATLYAGAMVATIPSDVVPGSYKWLLLKAVPRPRLIVYGGSSGHHGVDAAVLGRAFGMTGINIADNGGFAFADRVSALERYAGPGDVVLLMLEWPQYLETSGRNNIYRRVVLSILPDLFWLSAPSRQVELLYDLPLPLAVGVLAENTAARLGAGDRPSEEDRVRALREAAVGSAPNGSDASPVSRGLLPGLAEVGCAAYTEREMLPTPAVPASTLALFDRLAALQRRGVQILFSWPVMTGADCYADRSRVDAVAALIRDAVTSRGMRMLGTPYDLVVGPEYTDNTFYHVIRSGRAIVTARLSALLRAAGLPRLAGDPPSISDEALAALLALRRLLPDMDRWPEDDAVPGTVIAAGDAGDLMVWRDGWSGQEPTGRWSSEPRSNLRLSLPAPASLALTMAALGSPRRVTMTANGVTVGQLMVGTTFETHAVTIPAGLPGRCCEIGFALDGPLVSPAAIGIGADPRLLGIHLRAIAVSAP